MPIIQGIKRINPLDLNKNVTIGVAFPLDETNLFNGTETIREQVKSNLINLLLTQPGERIFLPKYGVGLKYLLFEQQINLEILEEKIRTQTIRYIPQIEITELRTGLSEDQHTVFINISYRFFTDNNTDSIQLNFN
jgi:phage baseplate assembly protein W